MADGDYQIRFPDLDDWAATLARAPEMVIDEMNRFFARIMPMLESEIVDRTPTDLGNLRRSIVGRREISPERIIGVIGTPLSYAPVVEHGARPHPVSEAGILALAEWAKRKLPLGQTFSPKTGRPLKTKGLDEAAMSAAHAIAWRIRHRGTKGSFMFRDAYRANGGRVAGEYLATWRRILDRLGTP